MSFLDKIKTIGSPAASNAAGNGEPGDAQNSGFHDVGATRPMREDEPTMKLPPQSASIISEGMPTELSSIEFAETSHSPSFAPSTVIGSLSDAAEPAPAVPPAGALRQRQMLLTALVVLGLLGTTLAVVVSLVGASRGGAQVRAAGQALMQSQRLAKSVSSALVGTPGAFVEVKESVGSLTGVVDNLRTGNGPLAIAPAKVQATLETINPLVQRADKNGRMVLSQEKVLTQVGQALKAINRQSSDLLESAEAVASQPALQNSSPAEIAAAGNLVMLTQRIGKGANEFLTQDGVSPEAVFLLGKDLAAFKRITEGLLSGNPELRLSAAKDPQLRERLNTLLTQFEQTRTQASAILGNLQALVAAREAQSSILADSEPLRKGLEQTAQELEDASGISLWQILLLLASLAALVGGALGFLRLFVAEQASRAAAAELRKSDAEAQEQQAKRVNDANQAAILRLMNELQYVAEGDLTQQATVTEDITGAIADSVNYTVEELRNLVGQVQTTANRVTDTTSQVDQTSTDLLAASNEQLHEIRATGEAVLQMAGRINDVSAQAQQTAHVARQSRQAAESGLQAMQNNISGMNAIREHIQETSKRIKRLGESSQEIGEITELISDITEQTNVLALNAAIQAASAGEAGRGFSVVAEEVQRLAERSGDATRRIAALVKTIQTDTHDAVAAMERSTVGVVAGTKLSDAAGAALQEIDTVSRRLDDLIAQISTQALSEAASANEVASNIQHIFSVTELTGEGTRSTAQMVRELSRSAEALKASVSRFKVS